MFYQSDKLISQRLKNLYDQLETLTREEHFINSVKGNDISEFNKLYDLSEQKHIIKNQIDILLETLFPEKSEINFV